MKKEDLKYIDFDNDPKVAQLEEEASKTNSLILWGPVQWTQNEPLLRLAIIDRSWVGCKIIYRFKRKMVIDKGLCKEYLKGHLFLGDTYLGSFGPDTTSTLDKFGNYERLIFENSEFTSQFEIDMKEKFDFPPEFQKCKIIAGSIDYEFGLLTIQFNSFPGLVDVICSYEWENK